ncbi:leucine-rich repeat domain-containing protein [Mycoplasma sp. Z244C]
MKTYKLFTLLTATCSTSIITTPLVASACSDNNQNNNNNINNKKPQTTIVDTPDESNPLDSNSDVMEITYPFSWVKKSNERDEALIEYSAKDKKLSFKNFEVVGKDELSYAKNAISNKYGDKIDIFLDCPDAKIVDALSNDFDYIKIINVNLPKLEKITYNDADEPIKWHKSWINSLTDDKVVQNGFLLKWDNAKGAIKDDTITKILPSAFIIGNGITSIDFPNLKIIPDNLFSWGLALKDVNVPSVTTIGKNAFDHAENLETLNAPNLKEIGFMAFSNTPKLKSKIVANKKLIKWAGASGDIVDDTITSIGDGAFENNQNITSVSFPNVTSVGYGAFSYATNLTSINIPKLEEASSASFYNTPKLTGKIVINNKLLKWSDASGDISDDNITSIDDYVFNKNKNITSVSFPNVTSMGNNVFYDAANLTSVNMPKLEELGESNFVNTPKLKGKIVLNGILIKWSDASGDITDDTITKIGEFVFINNNDITSVSFPNVTSIGQYAFAGAINLKTASFPSAKKIDFRAFATAEKMTFALFPNVESIDELAFQDTINLSKFVFNKSKLISVGNDAFYNTPKLVIKPS